jgi:hypothetical protein
MGTMMLQTVCMARTLRNATGTAPKSLIGATRLTEVPVCRDVGRQMGGRAGEPADDLVVLGDQPGVA